MREGGGRGKGAGDCAMKVWTEGARHSGSGGGVQGVMSRWW